MNQTEDLIKKAYHPGMTEEEFCATILQELYKLKFQGDKDVPNFEERYKNYKQEQLNIFKSNKESGKLSGHLYYVLYALYNLRREIRYDIENGEDRQKTIETAQQTIGSEMDLTDQDGWLYRQPKSRAKWQNKHTVERFVLNAKGNPEIIPLLDKFCCEEEGYYKIPKELSTFSRPDTVNVYMSKPITDEQKQKFIKQFSPYIRKQDPTKTNIIDGNIIADGIAVAHELSHDEVKEIVKNCPSSVQFDLIHFLNERPSMSLGMKCVFDEFIPAYLKLFPQEKKTTQGKLTTLGFVPSKQNHNPIPMIQKQEDNFSLNLVDLGKLFAKLYTTQNDLTVHELNKKAKELSQKMIEKLEKSPYASKEQIQELLYLRGIELSCLNVLNLKFEKETDRYDYRLYTGQYISAYTTFVEKILSNKNHDLIDTKLLNLLKKDPFSFSKEIDGTIVKKGDQALDKINNQFEAKKKTAGISFDRITDLNGLFKEIKSFSSENQSSPNIKVSENSTESEETSSAKTSIQSKQLFKILSNSSQKGKEENKKKGIETTMKEMGFNEETTQTNPKILRKEYNGNPIEFISVSDIAKKLQTQDAKTVYEIIARTYMMMKSAKATHDTGKTSEFMKPEENYVSALGVLSACNNRLAELGLLPKEEVKESGKMYLEAVKKVDLLASEGKSKVQEEDFWNAGIYSIRNNHEANIDISIKNYADGQISIGSMKFKTPDNAKNLGKNIMQLLTPEQKLAKELEFNKNFY